MADPRPEIVATPVAVPAKELERSGTGQMTDEECLRGRAIHAEARAAAAEAREAKMALRLLMDAIPQVRQARQTVTQTEQDLALAQMKDQVFREEVGGRLGLDLSHPARADVDWNTGKVTLNEADIDATPPE